MTKTLTCFFANMDPTGADHTEDVRVAGGSAEVRRSFPRTFTGDPTAYCAGCRRGRRPTVSKRTPGYKSLEGKPLPIFKDGSHDD